MNFKRITAAALALVMTASTAAFAAELPEGWTPADGARLISANPYAGNYETTITINGEALVSYEYTKENPETWETETITMQLSEISAVPAGYVPLRAIAQADHGSAYWDAEENQSWFNLGDIRIVTYFDDMSIEVDDEKLEDVSALLIKGVTYIPVSVIDGLEGFSVTDNSADGVESYEITTPNGTPLMKLVYSLMDTAGMGLGMKQSFEDLEEYYGEALSFKAEFVTEGVAYMPMMMTPDTLILGKVAEGKTEELQAALEVFRQQQEDTFSWYLSQNLPKVENAKFVTEGDWFLFLIAENADEAVEVFKTAVAEME
ncbi:MAG: DUF4358 domain-containing protein [Oscillospiraceae bacterium]|nr:DUF4358 domain-containing protein [Oscillospiraceae bacterium]